MFAKQELLSRDFVHVIEKDLIELIRQLPNIHPNSQGIANTVYGLSMFAKQELLSRDFVHAIEKDLIKLIRQLPNIHPNSQELRIQCMD